MARQKDSIMQNSPKHSGFENPVVGKPISAGSIIFKNIDGTIMTVSGSKKNKIVRDFIPSLDAATLSVMAGQEITCKRLNHSKYDVIAFMYCQKRREFEFRVLRDGSIKLSTINELIAFVVPAGFEKDYRIELYSRYLK